MAIRDEYGYTKGRLELGTWDMDATATLTKAHGLSATEWKTIENTKAIIRNDDDTEHRDINTIDAVATGIMAGSILSIDSVNIRISRYTTGLFDNTNHDTITAPGITSRGWITFKYIAD